jgi:Bacterial EndoU nuclease
VSPELPGANVPDKTEFPSSWSPDRIIDRVSNIANDPNIPTQTDSRGTPYKQGTRDGLEIRVNFYPSNSQRAGQIATGYPVNVRPNPPTPTPPPSGGP